MESWSSILPAGFFVLLFTHSQTTLAITVSNMTPSHPLSSLKDVARGETSRISPHVDPIFRCVLTDDIIMLFMYRQNKITLLGVLLFWINIINDNLDGAILKNRNIWFCIEIPQIKLVRFCTRTCCKKCILPWSEMKRLSPQQNYHRHPALLIICNNRIPYTSYIFIQSSSV